MGGNKRLKIMVLSGGGAHATTYPGVWQVIYDRIYPDDDSVDEDYIPDYIIGTSGGALFGCLMAAKKDGKLISGKSIKDKFKEQKPWELVRIPAIGEGLNFLLDWGLIDIEKIIKRIEKIFNDYGIMWESLDKPAFQCVVTDLTSGMRRYITKESGISIATSVGASLAIPGIFTPVWTYLENFEEKHCLVDGGACEGLPIGAALKLAPEDAKNKLKILAISPFKSVLGENGGLQETNEIKDLRDYMQALSRSIIGNKSLDMIKILECSGVENVRLYTGSRAKNLTDFSQETIENNYQLGRDAAYAKIDEIDRFFKNP